MPYSIAIPIIYSHNRGHIQTNKITLFYNMASQLLALLSKLVAQYINKDH